MGPAVATGRKPTAALRSAECPETAWEYWRRRIPQSLGVARSVRLHTAVTAVWRPPPCTQQSSTAEASMPPPQHHPLPEGYIMMRDRSTTHAPPDCKPFASAAWQAAAARGGASHRIHIPIRWPAAQQRHPRGPRLCAAAHVARCPYAALLCARQSASETGRLGRSTPQTLATHRARGGPAGGARGASFSRRSSGSTMQQRQQRRQHAPSSCNPRYHPF